MEIPDKFYKGELEHPRAVDVGDMIDILNELPRHLPLCEDLRVIVYNVLLGRPAVGFSED